MHSLMTHHMKFSFKLFQIRFFKDVRPENLLLDPALFQHLIERMDTLVQWVDASSRDDVMGGPWLEGCVQSHHTDDGVCYQLFDTELHSFDDANND